MLLAGLQQGVPVGAAMRRYPNEFDPVVTEIVDAALRAPHPADGLRSAALSMEKNRPLTFRALAFGSSLWSYFTIYLPITLTIALVIALPWLVVMLGVAACGRDPLRFWHRVRRRMPLFGGVFECVVFSRFTQVFAACATAGVPLARAVELGAGRMGDRELGAAILSQVAGIREGKKVSGALRDTGQVPRWVLSVIETAEDTGRFGGTSNKLTEYLLDDAEHALDRTVGHGLWMIPAAIGFVVFLVVLAAMLRYAAGYAGIEVPGPRELWRQLWTRPGAGG